MPTFHLIKEILFLQELVSLMEPPMDHLIENSEDLRVQFNSQSIKLEHSVCPLVRKVWLERWKARIPGRREGLRREGGGEPRALWSTETLRGPPGTHSPSLVPSLAPGNIPLAYFLSEAARKDIFFAPSQCLALKEAALCESSVVIPLGFSSV